jgi:hypothetical protein
MKGMWLVTSNPLCGRTFYRVFRIRDTNAVDHSGNREYYGEYMENKAEAKELADRLNKEGK